MTDSSKDSSFEHLSLRPALLRGITELGYTVPTPVQRATIPLAVRGQDVIGVAQTGTGKTAAFLLPILERLVEQPPHQIHALVLTPTRELALQADEFLRQLGRHTRVRGAAVYGGVGMGEQERALRGGAEIVVATPGRLLDHLSRGYVDLRHLTILVLDEADRMLDMGFLPDVRRILNRLPRQRQTLLFSATMPPEVVKLSREFLHNPAIVRIESETVAAERIVHRAIEVPGDRKTEALVRLLEDPAMTSVLVFVRTKRRADRLARQLGTARVPSAVIHGNRSQSQRVTALEGFRKGHHRILVATDIAARGVDVEGVSHVINYDLPNEVEVYVHRVGRTARAEREGDAVSLVAPEDREALARIERHLGLRIRRDVLPGGPLMAIPLVQVNPHVGSGRGGEYARRGRRFERPSNRRRDGGRRTSGGGGPPRRPYARRR
jgi:ATP-dependent RNA helicase RhlE